MPIVDLFTGCGGVRAARTMSQRSRFSVMAERDDRFA
jgi:hypothetical protein